MFYQIYSIDNENCNEGKGIWVVEIPQKKACREWLDSGDSQPNAAARLADRHHCDILVLKNHFGTGHSKTALDYACCKILAFRNAATVPSTRQDHGQIIIVLQHMCTNREAKVHRNSHCCQKRIGFTAFVAKVSFDLTTSRLWASHAPTAPLRCRFSQKLSLYCKVSTRRT